MVEAVGDSQYGCEPQGSAFVMGTVEDLVAAAFGGQGGMQRHRGGNVQALAARTLGNAPAAYDLGGLFRVVRVVRRVADVVKTARYVEQSLEARRETPGAGEAIMDLACEESHEIGVGVFVPVLGTEFRGSR